MPSGRSIVGRVSAGLCVLVALFSYRYLVGRGPVPPLVAANRFLHPWIALHAAGAATALLVAPLQLWARLRAGRPALHRWLGRLYVAGCLGGGASGFVLALGASTGPVATAGFAALALAWVATTALGWRAARRRCLAEHRAWMMRSFALTFAAVTLRLYLQLLFVLPVPFADGYRAISFLCWVPNLLLAERWLRRARPRSRCRRRMTAAAG